MIDQLLNADRQLFTFINSHNDTILDFVMMWAADKWIWIPFYVWLLYMLYKIHGKNVIWILITVALMITFSDQVSVYIKNTFGRLRPCHDPILQSVIHLADGCGGKFGFISSHASNSAALAIFTGMLLPEGYRWVRYELAGYVLIVGYSRIYLAAHFPGDVLGGWLLGLVAAILGLILFKFIQGKQLKTENR